MKFNALKIVVFLTIVLHRWPDNTVAAPQPQLFQNGLDATHSTTEQRPKNNWKNEICTELGHLLLAADEINELKHCSTTFTNIQTRINERVTNIRRILNNHGTMCTTGIEPGVNSDVRQQQHGQHQHGRGKFNKNSFD